jgi:hypothetical protein
MNERIKELAQQSKLAELYDRYVEQCMKNADDDILDYDVIVKEFAELIVRECSKVIRHGGQRKGAFGNEDLRPSEIATMIEEHFGVEE